MRITITFEITTDQRRAVAMQMGVNDKPLDYAETKGYLYDQAMGCVDECMSQYIIWTENQPKEPAP